MLSRSPFTAYLRPGVTIDERGAPVLTFGIGGCLAEERETPVAVAFDEFQQITTYDAGSRLEQKLRSVVQHHEDVAYLFWGSRKHMIQEMFLSSERPLYCSAEHCSRSGRSRRRGGARSSKSASRGGRSFAGARVLHHHH